MSIEELLQFLDEHFPQIRFSGKNNPDALAEMEIISVGPGTCTMRLPFYQKNLRPGGTLSGPAMFALADVGLYVVILAHIGPVGLAVTTNMTINFLNRPNPQALIAECQLLKMGKRLAVGEVRLFTEDDNSLVAHATGTYSIPPVR